MASHLCSGGGIAILAFTTSVWHLMPFVALYAFGARASFPVLTSLLAEYFGRTNFGKIQGVLYSVFSAAGGIGPLIAAAVRDAHGSYTPVFAGYAGATVVSAVAITLVRKPKPAVMAPSSIPSQAV